MSNCCSHAGASQPAIKTSDPCQAPAMAPGGCGMAPPPPVAWFADMVPHALAYAKEQKAQGRPVVGIMCEYTPREIIMAAGAVPVCLCGGFAEMIPPAEQELPSNLCPLIKSTYGFSVEKANPFLDLADLLVAETTCDGKKKMFELLGRRHPMHVLELPQKPDDADAFAHWVQELAKLKLALEKRLACQITEEALRAAIHRMNEERHWRRKLAGLMKSVAPPLTGRELLDMKSLISCIPADLKQYRQAIETLPGRQLQPPAAQRVRVLLTGVPLPHGAERVMDLIESNGGLVVCQENCTGLKPLLEDVNPGAAHPLHAIAEKYFHLPCSVMTPNNGRRETLKQLSAEYRPQCVIELVWQACLTYDVETAHVRQWVDQDLHLPYLRIETDYAPSDSARIAVRVQALFETVLAQAHQRA